MSAQAARSGEMAQPFGSSSVVATRPCRRCGEPCEVTEAGMEALKASNRILLARGEMPLNERAVFACDACDGQIRELAGEANRQRVDGMRAVILDLKDSMDPASEKELLEALRELGHPDIPALLHAIGERKAGEKTPRRSK